MDNNPKYKHGAAPYSVLHHAFCITTLFGIRKSGIFLFSRARPSEAGNRRGYKGDAAFI